MSFAGGIRRGRGGPLAVPASLGKFRRVVLHGEADVHPLSPEKSVRPLHPSGRTGKPRFETLRRSEDRVVV